MVVICVQLEDQWQILNLKNLKQKDTDAWIVETSLRELEKE